MGPARASCGDLAGSLRLSQESMIILGPRKQSKTLRCPHDHRAVPVRGSYDVTAMCLRATGLRFFHICHCAELNKIVEATMPVNPYDGRKVFLRRPHGNGDLDIVGASYTRRKANVTEELLIRETSQFLCYERLLNMTNVAYKSAFFREMQFWSHCYTVVSYQALFRLSVYKIPAVYLSGAKNVCFCTIRDFSSPTIGDTNRLVFQ